MNIDQDLEKIALQERRLQFQHFDSGMAWALGTALKAAAEKRQVAVAIDIQLHGHPLFSYAMPGTTPDNWDWIRRKRNVVLRFHRSSYAVGLNLRQKNETLFDKYGLSPARYASHGGSFPIAASGAGIIGSVTVSGLSQRADHELVVEALCGQIGRDYTNLALPTRAG